MRRFYSKLNEERENTYWDSIFYPRRFLEPSALLSAHSSYLLRTAKTFPINHNKSENWRNNKYMPSLQHTVSDKSIKICKDRKEADVKNSQKLTTAKNKEKTEEQLIKSNNNIQPSTSKINDEEEDDCLVIFETLNNTTKCYSKKEGKENEMKRKIKNEEITGDYLKKMLQDKEGEKEEMIDSGEDIGSLECIDEEDSNEDFDMRDMDLRVEIGENDLENSQNIPDDEEEKEEKEIKEEEQEEEVEERRYEVKEENEEERDEENEEETNDKVNGEERREEEREDDEEIEDEEMDEYEENFDGVMEGEEEDEEEKNNEEKEDGRNDDVEDKKEMDEEAGEEDDGLDEEEYEEVDEYEESVDGAMEGERKEEKNGEKKDDVEDKKEETEEEDEFNEEEYEQVEEYEESVEGVMEGEGKDEEKKEEREEEKKGDVVDEEEEMGEGEEMEESDDLDEEEYEESVDEVMEEGKDEEKNQEREEEKKDDVEDEKEESGKNEKDYVREKSKKEENAFTTSGKEQNFSEKESRQGGVKDINCKNKEEDGCLRLILKGNNNSLLPKSVSEEKEEKYRRILEEIRSKKQREKDENNSKMASNEIQKSQQFLGDIPSTSKDSLTAPENIQSTSQVVQSSNNLESSTPRNIRASSEDIPSPSKNIQTKARNERRLSNEIPSIPRDAQKRLKEIQNPKDFKKPRIDNNNYLKSPIDNETPQRSKMKIIPLGDIIIKDPRLKKDKYGKEAIECLEKGVLLPEFKINNLINNSGKKELKNQNEEIKNSDKNIDESTPMEIEEAGQSSNEGQQDPRFHQAINYQEWERQNWLMQNNQWLPPPPPFPPPLAQMRFYPPQNQPNSENTMASVQNNSAQQQECRKRFDSQPSGDSGNSGNEVTVDNSSTTKSSQTELSFSKDETFDVNLKHKIEEITNLRVQLSKKDEELNHLKSLQISSETLADRLKLKDKIINECKVRMAENDEKIEKLEGEVVQLNQQNYMLELDKKNYNSKKEAESPALNKLQSEYQHLLKDLSEQRKETKKAEEANKINEEKCKRLNSDIKHQKDCYDDWQKQTLNNHKKELQEEIKKINEQHRDEIKRMTESSLLKQKSDGKSQLQIKEFENKRLNAELETQRKTLEEEIRKSSDNYKKMEAKYRKAVLENQELQQINYNKFEEWKRTELDRHINGFNLEILKIKEEHKNELEMKEKEFKELKKRLKQETVGELKKAVFENIEEEKQQPKTSNHQNIQENQEEIRKRLESEYSNKLKNSLRDICEEQHRIKIKKEQLDSMILKQQCTDCELFKFAYNKMKEKNDNCLKSGCEICSGTRSLDSLECQSSFQSSANSSNNQPSPKTPPKHKETSRKRNNQGHLKSNNDSSQSAGQISATRQVFNNSNDIEPGRRTVESGTSSLISIPPLDPQQPEINKSVTVDIKVEMDDAGLDAQLEIQNKNLENNIRLIRSKSVAALYSPPPPPPQTFPITQTNIQSTSRMEDFINPPQPPTYLQTISDNNFRFNQQQFNSVGNSQITTPQIFPQQQTQNQNLQHLGVQQNTQLIYSSEQQQRQLFQQPTIQQQQQIHYPSNISYASSLPLNNPQMIQQNQMSQYQTAQQNRTAPQPIIQNNLNQQNVDFSSNSAMQQLVQQQANFQQQQQVRLPHHQTYNQPQNQNYSTGRPTDPRFQNSAIFNALFSMMQQHSQSQQQPQVNNPQQVQQQPKNKSRRKK